MIEKGYVELTEEHAKIYADGFRKASLLKEERDTVLPEIDAKRQILETSIDYVFNSEELKDFDIPSIFPTQNKLTKK